MLKRKSLVLAKVETTSGTDIVPTPADNAILVSDLDVKVDGQTLERNFDRPSLSPLEHIIGTKEVEVTFKTELKGSGSANIGGADDVPEIDALLQSCGMAPTLTAETSEGDGDGLIEYDPVSENIKTISLYAYLDGIVFKIPGCAGSMKMNMEAGGLPLMEWNLKGLFQLPTDAAIPTGAAYNSEKASPFINAAFTVGGFASKFQSLSIDLANDIQKIDDANAPEGVAGYLITGRDTQGSFNPQAELEATHPFWTNWKNGTALALTTTLGAVAGKKIDITAPKVQYREITMGDRNGVRTYEIPMRLAQESGDDELKLKFY